MKHFRRLLRWYPARWRALNGDVLLSTMLDAAQREGRARPTWSEHWYGFIHGTSAHIDRRLAVRSSIAALTLLVISGIALVWGIAPLSEAGLGWTYQIVVTGAVPALTAVALVAVVREKGWVADVRALAATLLSVTAVCLATLTSLSWSMGFDAADAGVPLTGLATLFLPLFLTALVVGALAIAVLLESLLQRTMTNRASRMLAAGAAGLFAAPVVGLTMSTPYVSAVIALGVAVLGLIQTSSAAAREQKTTPRVDAATVARNSLTRKSLVAVRVLSTVAFLGGVVGVTYALTGAHWSPAATDGTVAMAQGIIALLLSSIPLLGAFGLTTSVRRHQRRLHTWGPICAAMLSVGLVAIAYLNAPERDGMALWFTVASALGGVAITWWTIPRVRLARPAPVLIGVFAGLLYAAFLGMMLLPMLSFAVPVLAVLVATLGTRSTHHNKHVAQVGRQTDSQAASSGTSTSQSAHG
jgi:hypothetical protein